MNTDSTIQPISRQTFFIRYKTLCVLGGLMVCVTLLSVLVFMRQSLRLDEAQSLWQTSRSPAKVFNIIAQDVHVPFYHMMLHYWQLYLGNSVITGRLFSLLFFLISIFAFYKLAKLVYGKREAYFGTTLFAISPFMNWYGNEIRMYSLFTLLIIIHQCLFIKLFKYTGSARPRNTWIWYTIVSVAGIFTHYFFFFSLATQAVFFIANKTLFETKDLSKFLKVLSVIALTFTPWIVYVLTLGTISNSAPLLITPDSVNIFNTFSQFLFGFQTDRINTILVSLWPLLVLFSFIGLQKNKRTTPETVYFVLAFTLPLVLAFLLSITFRPLYVSRYLILSLPSLFMLVVGFTSKLPSLIKRLFEYALVTLMLITLAIQAFSAFTPVKEKYHEASDYLTAHASAADTIVVSAPFTIYPIEYYYTGPSRITTLPIWDRTKYGPIPAFSTQQLQSDASTINAGHENMWLLLSYDQGYQEELRLYFDQRYERLDTVNFSPGLDLYKYKLRY